MSRRHPRRADPERELLLALEHVLDSYLHGKQLRVSDRPEDATVAVPTGVLVEAARILTGLKTLRAGGQPHG